MKQAIMTKPGYIEYREVEKPTPGPGEIVLAVKRIGICGTDIHVWHGKHPFTPYPVVQGHEFSATVESIGEGVTKVAPGQRATCAPQLVCHVCKPCKRGDYHICDHLQVRGFQAPGCAQEYFLTTEERIVPFDDTLSFDQGALIEPAAVAAHATNRCRDLTGENILVLGAGTIGILVAQAAKCRGAAKVLITDLSDFRLQKAKEASIDATCNIKSENLKAVLEKTFGDEGFNIAFEAVGVEASLNDAIENIQKGGEVVVLGVFGDNPRVNMSIVGDREISLIGTLMYKQEDYKQAVEWITMGKMITAPLVTKHFPFSKYADAYHFIDKQADKTLKVVIDIAE